MDLSFLREFKELPNMEWNIDRILCPFCLSVDAFFFGLSITGAPLPLIAWVLPIVLLGVGIEFIVQVKYFNYFTRNFVSFLEILYIIIIALSFLYIFWLSEFSAMLFLISFVIFGINQYIRYKTDFNPYLMEFLFVMQTAIGSVYILSLIS